jgi:large subunit ribosomal protein L15
MISLDSLTSSGKKRKRIGRSGGRGGTSGKGHKGQKARSGPKIRVQYEGGQMPLTRRFPKHGFNNANFRTAYELVNLKELDARFEHGEVVNSQALFEKGLIKGGHRLLKILGDGTLSKKLVVHADKFSKSAAEHIVNAGGEVHHIVKVSSLTEKKKVQLRAA